MRVGFNRCCWELAVIAYNFIFIPSVSTHIWYDWVHWKKKNLLSCHLEVFFYSRLFIYSLFLKSVRRRLLLPIQPSKRIFQPRHDYFPHQVLSTLHEYPCLETCTPLLHYISGCVRLAWKMANHLVPYYLDQDFALGKSSIHTIAYKIAHQFTNLSIPRIACAAWSFSVRSKAEYECIAFTQNTSAWMMN